MGHSQLCVCREEFVGHGLSDVVTLECRDVCSQGFGLTDSVDAGTHTTLPLLYIPSIHHPSTVFLDLPNPWLAVGHAKEAIKVTNA